ncbi:MAG TPA: type VI secretion system tube protein Hcp, partial [Candidatus Dormibacteraeota bacterium]|nr:type VI secretion system tube protein Hcp [Candidatus Dormibacteraeota bacterium]
AAALLALVGGGGAFLYFRSASKPGLAALAVIVVVATAGAVLMTGGAAVAAGAAGPSAFLRLDDLRGDASDAAHPGAIELTSVGPADMLPPKLGGSFGPIHVGKGADRATAALFEAAASGRRFRCGLIFLSRTAGYDNVVYALSDVTVADFTQGAAEPGAATETLTLTYRVIAWSYQPLGPDGSPQGPAVRAGWDPVSKHAVTP